MTLTLAVAISEAHKFDARVESLIAAVQSFDTNTSESIESCEGDDVTRLVGEVLLRAKNDQSLLDAVFEHRLRWIRHDQIMHRDAAVFTEDYSKLAEYEALKPGSELRAVRDVLRDELGYCGIELYVALVKVVSTGMLNYGITTVEDLDGVLKAANISTTKTVRRI